MGRRNRTNRSIDEQRLTKSIDQFNTESSWGDFEATLVLQTTYKLGCKCIGELLGGHDYKWTNAAMERRWRWSNGEPITNPTRNVQEYQFLQVLVERKWLRLFVSHETMVRLPYVVKHVHKGPRKSPPKANVYLVVLGSSWPCLVRLCNELKYVSDEQESLAEWHYNLKWTGRRLSVKLFDGR